MWKSRLNQNHKGQQLSPFSTPSESSTVSSTPSPRVQTRLPSGVRYIRQTPDSIYRSVEHKGLASTPPKPSPTKRLRFADPLHCARKTCTDRTDSSKSSPIHKLSNSAKTIKPVNSVRVVKPVFSQGFLDQNLKSPQKTIIKTSAKTMALSPASRSRSPIFSTVDFSDKTNGKTSTPKTITTPKTTSISSSKSTTIASSGEVNCSSRSSPVQTETMIEIKTPNGTKWSTQKSKNDDKVHRSTLSIPLDSNNKSDQKSIAVNVNVAVGLDCNDMKSKNIAVGFDCNDMKSKNINLNRETNDDNDIEYYDAHDHSDGISSSLKVAVRLRPFLRSEIDSDNDISVIDMKGNTVRIINSDNENYNKLEFGFDVCLNSSDRDLFDYSDQDSVYRKLAEPLLDRSLEGYNVCLFAYGQTGSGKSYTMMGSESIPGIIPRFAKELYKRIGSLNDVVITVKISYFEIYNEKIYDLLSDKLVYNKKTLRVRENPKTGPYVEDLSLHVAYDYEEIMDLLMSGKTRRATASTAANDESSRSHSIFTILLSQLKKDDECLLDKSSSCTSKINLVDLAGSERVGNTEAKGDRLIEGNLINKSLLTLGKVISQLAENSSNHKTVFVPYRESILTYLLKESLGGNSRTSMIATISPAKCHLEETLSTLRYAAIARRIVNFVRINEDPKAMIIKELMAEVALLQQQINNANSLKSINDNPSDDNKEPPIIAKIIETCSKTTETSFTMDDNPTQFDLIRTQLLEEQQRGLLNEIRKQQQNIFPDEIPEKSDSELLQKIHDLFDDILNKSRFESSDTTDDSTLVASNTSNNCNAKDSSNGWQMD